MIIYKLCSNVDWDACQRDGSLPWSTADREDGFVHLSTATQVQATAAKHYRHRAELRLLLVDTARLAESALRWEVSRGGDLFPHLYGELPLVAVTQSVALALDDDGVPVIPPELAQSGVPAS